jgi:hypothetical protein
MFVYISNIVYGKKNQGCGSGSELDPDSIWSVDPDPDRTFFSLQFLVMKPWIHTGSRSGLAFSIS